jgi:Trk K+ transport system NAD-binding subunit
MIAIVYAVKLFPVLILKLFFSWRETIGAGFLLSSRLSLIIAVSLVAWRAGVITETTHSTFILVAVVTCIISPLLFSKIFPETVQKKTGILFAGNHEIIVSLAKKLSPGETALIIADSGERIPQRLNELHLPYLYWDKLRRGRERELKDLAIQTFVAAYDNNSKNIEACAIAKEMGVPNIVAVVEDPRVSLALEKNGVKAVTPLKAMYTLLYGIVKYPESFEALYNPEEVDDIEVKEIKLTSQGIIGMKLKRLHLPGDCLILLVTRNGKRIVPDGNTRLEQGDVMVLIGTKEYIQSLETGS